MGAMLDVSYNAKELRRHVKRVADSKRILTEKTHEALSRQEFQEEKVWIERKGPGESADSYIKNNPNVLREQTSPTAYNIYF